MSFNSYQKKRLQSGMGYTGYLVVMAVAVFIGMFAIKVAPHYYQNWKVTQIAENVAANPEVLRQSKSKVYEHLNQAYRTQNLWDLKASETIVLEPDKRKGYIVTVQYERRDKLFHNISVITNFDTVAN